MKRLVLLLALGASLVVTATASAHPLGNFTINRFSRIEVSGHRLYVRYVLDMAEIPTFQARQEGLTGEIYARRIAAGTHLTVDGKRVRLVALGHALAFPQGAGGLQTTRLEVILGGPRIEGAARIRYVDLNYASHIGWKEIVVGAAAPSRSDELRAYPKDLLQSPPTVTAVSTTLAPTDGPDVPPGLTHGKALQAPDRVAESGFASLIARDRLTTGFVLVSLLVSFFWGAAHALSPGHGKSIVAAYLVGARGTPRHAVLLGLTVTVTHTIGVFALGLVTLSLSAFIVPSDLYPWLNLVSALLVVGVGLSVLRWRVREWRRGPSVHDHGHSHSHDHSHGAAHLHVKGDHHDHGHSHDHDPALGMRRLLGIGVSGGIIPCPTALVVLLAAISLHRVGYGLVLILAFSCGLAATMTGIGLLAVSAKRLFRRVELEGSLIRLLPALSALVVLALGIAMTARALPKVS
jgi:nickel/cobalt exporter